MLRRHVGVERTASRRNVLASMGAAGLGLGLGGSALGAGAGALRMGAGTVDVHNHYFPPSLADAANQMLSSINNGSVPARIRDWTPARAVEAMDRNGVAKAVVSTSWRPALAGMPRDRLRAVAREANEYAMRMEQDHRGRFQHFAFLPMPDVDLALEEIAYNLDVLKAPGVAMMTSYGDRWQGHPSFVPILQELNRRKAVVFCHPLPAACCGNLMPDVTGSEADLVEFPFDTARAMVGLLMSGQFAKYPDIRWIFCHCGGPLPALSGRIRAKVAYMDPEKVAEFAPHGVDHEFQRQFYDTADAAYGPPMAAVMNYIPPTQLLFGTDFPYVEVDDNVRELMARRLSQSVMSGLEKANAVRLMPQLA